MKIFVSKTKAEASKEAYEVFANDISKGDIKTIGLATGSTPLDFYKYARGAQPNCENITTVNLDEYVGLAPDHDQSYNYFMHENLFDSVKFEKHYLPNGLAEDSEAECARYDKVLDENPLDWQLLGIGGNGHIGFNEPGASFEGTTQRVKLTEATLEANARFFDSIDEVPTEAYSMGIGSILKSKKIVLLAFGEEKAAAIKAMIEGPVTNEVPATALQSHDNVMVFLDEAAASLLSK
ncbi:glucosamine-6-phosphate deaminase [Brochothrix thermosphacta]|uniref:glucosamine-6-phosphate deaminase n=1 Tax=Brochothrix thermosphacta TaxID=2756 RepID=UPI000E75FD0E|nr:glucosamine-6-phosphate deaminase [Brochothrix thermosphacta]ANZ94259.1 glucosamine-6-phosphate deaminase [Brochothrix thermosphacta]